MPMTESVPLIWRGIGIGRGVNGYETHGCHGNELPVLHYHKIRVIYPYPFLVVINQLFSWIIFMNGRIYILNGFPG